MSDEEETKELNPGSTDEKSKAKPTPKSESPSSSTSTGPIHDQIEKIRHFISEKLHLYSKDDETDTRTVLDSVDIHGVIKHWKKGGFKKIVTMVGAGISTSAGIPDFRSPNTGLYANLMKYDLPYPEAIFDLEFFKKNPKPFFQLAKELYPGTFKPTPSHYFVKLLHDKGLLVRHYTQNIDTLDRLVGIPEEKIVEAHGTFFSNHCIVCNEEYNMEWAKKEIFEETTPTCTKCEGVVKPDIVFFGENLPEKFHILPHQDFKECDLLLIMGTSLTVQPFASLVDYVQDDCVRLLINRDKVAGSVGVFRSLFFGEGLCFDLPGNRRDVVWQNDCDEGCQFLADQLGFGDELRELVKTEHEKINKLNENRSAKDENKAESAQTNNQAEKDKDNTDEDNNKANAAQKK